MFEFLQSTFFGNPAIIALTILYFILASITTFDIRLMQARKSGVLSSDEDLLPKWVAVFFWLEWGVFIILAVLNWKYAIALFILKFILKVLPVLETVGNLIMSPLKIKK